MEDKIDKTVNKTIDSLARIERFIIKYGSQMSVEQKAKIVIKINELQKKVDNTLKR